MYAKEEPIRIETMNPQGGRGPEPIYTSYVHSFLQSIDWRSFLSRPYLPPPPPEALDALRQQPIFITGAGGSIGSALALRLGAMMPPELVLLEASESNLYALQRDWPAEWAAGPRAAKSVSPILGSATDEAQLHEIFATHAPRIVFHAAAFKHVPLMEEHPLAAIQNNIFSTELLSQAALTHGARMVLLSTDKAVAPTSVMGATKRVAEQITLAGGGTVLRLVNVLASRDSVAEIFAWQIAHGGPVTVTNAAARRYFITLHEAINLLLKATTLHEPGLLLAPVLPAAHLITDLARFMAFALSPQHEIAINFTGNRPGDKEIEQLWSPAQPIHTTSYDELVAVEAAQPGQAQLTDLLVRLHAAVDHRDPGEALSALRALVPDYTPSQAALAYAAQCGSRACV